MKNTKANLLYCHLKDSKCKADNCMAWKAVEEDTLFGKYNWDVAYFINTVCAQDSTSETSNKLLSLGVIARRGGRLVPSYFNMSVKELNKIPWKTIVSKEPHYPTLPVSYGYCRLLSDE